MTRLHDGYGLTKAAQISRLKIFRISGNQSGNSFAADAAHGLLASPKFLLPKYFYDEKGSDLFEKICSTPEYYVTRTEDSILETHSAEIAFANRDKSVLVELGSGSSVKTRHLLCSFLDLHGRLKYVPIDVSDIMITSSRELLTEYPKLSIDAILSEYESGINLASEIIDEPKLILFLGSSIGNFNLPEADAFVTHISEVMKQGDSLLIGFDLVKDTNVLEPAYDDSEGVTAAFNLNLLERINRELGGEFDLNSFKHFAYFNESKSRVEMHLVSTKEQDICIHGIREKIHFSKGETIHTENSYKFTDKMIAEIAEKAGLSIINKWRDTNSYFELTLFRK